MFGYNSINMGKITDWLFGPIEAAPKIETRGPGSVASIGGDSPLGVIPRPAGTATGVSVSEALSIASVYRAVSVISTTVSQLPIQVFRKDEQIEISSANSNLWIRQPNLDISQTAFLQQTVFSMITRGNAYWRLYGVEAPGDLCTGVEVLNPTAMSIEYNHEGRKVYKYNGYTEEKIFARYQIKHLKLTEIFGTEYGIGPIQACSVELKGILDLRNYAHNIFATGVFPTGIISVPDIMDPDLAKEYQRAFIAMTAGGLPAVFGNGGKYDANVFDPRAAQFIDNQQFAITQVARMFGIPASKLLAAVDGTSMTYSNMEQVNSEYVQDTLMSFINPIEDSLSDLLPRGQTVKLKVDGLLRADTAARYTALATATWMTPNEKRAMDNLPPMPGGDVLAAPAPVQTQANTDSQGVAA